MLESTELTDDRRQRSRDDRRIQRRQQHCEHEPAEGDQDLPTADHGGRAMLRTLRRRALPTKRQIQKTTNYADEQNYPGPLRRLPVGDAERGVDGVAAGSSERNRQRSRREHQWMLDAIGGDEERGLEVNRGQ